MSGLTADAYASIIDHTQVTPQNHAFTYDERIGKVLLLLSSCSVVSLSHEAAQSEVQVKWHSVAYGLTDTYGYELTFLHRNSLSPTLSY